MSYPAFGATKFGALNQFGANLAEYARQNRGLEDELAAILAAQGDGVDYPAIMGALPQAMQGAARNLGPMALVQALQARGLVPGARAGANILGGFGTPGPDAGMQTFTQASAITIPLESTGTVAAGGSQTITVQPQQPFRGERFMYTGPANTFKISDFRIINVPQFGVAGNVLADTYGPLAVLPPYRWTPCPQQGAISLTVQNQTLAAATFNASFLGSGLL